MKKILLSFVVLLMFSLNGFSQDDNERKLGVNEYPLPPMERTLAPGSSNDCKCDKNILQDGGFENVTAAGTKNNITDGSRPWYRNTASPQWTAGPGPCNNGTVYMWGNRTVGESIVQNGLSIVAGKTYNIKVTARFINPSSSSSGFVRLRIAAYNGTGTTVYNPTPVMGITPNISSASYVTHTLSWTATGNYNSIQLHPENDFAQNNGAYVSWIQLDNICIEEVCKIPNDRCNPKFTASPFTVNSQCNVVINVNPMVTSGATHYWGLLGASSQNDNTPIPLSTILSGGSFGLTVSSTGVATPIGMGTGITASTSGYGYQYSGVSFGECFKITHYIKCCDTWYSQTNTYCTKLCFDVREAGPTQVSTREAEDLQRVIKRLGLRQ